MQHPDVGALTLDGMCGIGTWDVVRDNARELHSRTRRPSGRPGARVFEKEIEKQKGRREDKTCPGGTAERPIMRVGQVFRFRD